MEQNNQTALFLSPGSGNLSELILNSKKPHNQASIRLQVMPAAKALNNIGYSAIVKGLYADNLQEIRDLNKPVVCIVCKLISYPEKQSGVNLANLIAIRSLKRKKVPILVLYSDHWCEQRDLAGDLYRSLLRLSDVIICPSKAIASQAEAWINKDTKIKIIEDPWQIKQHPFQSLDENSICRVIWFGHRANLSYLLREMPRILKECKSSREFELTILGDKNSLKHFVNSAIHEIPSVRPWRFRLIKWSLKYFTNELLRAHIALLPSDLKSEKSLASHNRAVDAMQAGCMVLASPLESYIELKDLLLVGNDFVKLLNYGIQNYDELTLKWEQIRTERLSRFSPNHNLKNWESCIKQIILKQ